jgi:hypothetical protein
MGEQQTNTTAEQAANKPGLDFESVYANNSLLESSVWDLKIMFGQLEQHTGNAKVDWHTAVTMPWMQAKVLCYYLRVNLAFHEMVSGPLKIHPNVAPPVPEPPAAEQCESDPKAQRLHEIIGRIHTEMFA